MKREPNYTIKWYWWVILVLIPVFGWFLAAIIYDDMYNSYQSDWEKEMEEYLKELER